ncbi:PHP domain-containing protein [Tersicoccus sp. MR15.9]|uniref:PHP domain-containing protein n=1 Tax=Tersicoccus mangrovi TaxID=3121635 RepID=UPI002FE641FF
MTETVSADGSGYVHLHNHAENSSLDGLSRVGRMPGIAAALGQKAMAITDHGSLAGALKFQNACLAAGIKPIIGMEAYLAIGSRFERNVETVVNDDENASDADEGKDKTKKYLHLTVLARNETGWKNLLALHNKAEESYWYKSRIDLDLLDEHGDGLIVLTGCLGGPVAGPLSRAGAAEKAGDAASAVAFRAEAEANLDRLIGAVGREHVFIEVMYHGIGAEAHAFRELRALAERTGLPLVATNDCHYEHAEDAHAHDAFLAVGVKKNLDDPKRFAFNGTPDYFIKSESQMLDVLGNIGNAEAAAAWRQACANTVMVADLCAERVIPDPVQRLPRYPVPDGFADSAAYFHHLVREGLIEKFGAKLPQEVKERARREEDVIVSMGFPDYFLIVWDVISWARSDYTAADWVRVQAGEVLDEATRERKKPILVGPGRGSAAGALVSYALGIVGLDPLANHLLFERFLEPGRAGMPDIDVDFEGARRDEVFAFLAVRWGQDRVAHIGTFGMALSKAAIKDAARILQPTADPQAARHMVSLGEKLAGLIPTAGGKPYPFAKLDDTTDPSGDAFRTLVDESGGEAQQILELARSFEGITKAESIHACGFIISPEPLDELVPMRWKSHAAGKPAYPRVICWDGGDCEAIGLLKMDVLGLINLDIAATALDYIADSTGERFSLGDIPDPSAIDHPTVRGAYALIGAGKTSGVFQMEGAGMTRVGQDVAPESLDDLSAVVALFRPGPLAAKMPDSYANRKAGRESVSYTAFTHDPVETEWISSVFGDDQGMAIYQETIMRLGTVVAGFDAAQRSRLRKAMGKKKKSEMDAVYEMWVVGAPREFHDENGTLISPAFSESTAQRLWDFIAGAAEYLFNKCITGDAVLHGPGGARISVQSLYEQSRTGAILSLDLLAYDLAAGQITAQPVKTVHRNGVKPVFRIACASGRSIKATGNHRLLGRTDYVHVEDLQPGDQLRSATGLDTIVSITAAGEEMTYDVEMAEGTDHNFVVNGIVSHNSHSAAYGLLAFWTAYLKAGWPVEYAAAILAVAEKEEKRLTALSALREDGIPVGSPDLNLSGISTAPVEGTVMLGLSEIKDVGAAATHIVAERDAGGPFTGMADLLDRVKVPGDKGSVARISVTAANALIESGAMDAFGPRLGQTMSLRAMRGGATEVTDAEWHAVERHARQRFRLGVGLGEHPLTSLAGALKAWQAPAGSPLVPLHRIADEDGQTVMTVGVISAWAEKGYAGGRRANFSLESSKVSMNGVVWDRTLSKLRRGGTVPKVGDIVAVAGRVKVRTIELARDDHEADAEDGLEAEVAADKVVETITVKELSVDDVWFPVPQAPAPVVAPPATVIDFAARYRALRSGPANPDAKPARTRKPSPSPTAVPAPERATAASESGAQPVPVEAVVVDIVERIARRDPGVAVIVVDEFATRATGYRLTGDNAVAKRHAMENLPEPKGAVDGFTYRCVTDAGDVLYLITESEDLDLGAAAAAATSAPEEAWVGLPARSSASKALWYRMPSTPVLAPVLLAG